MNLRLEEWHIPADKLKRQIQVRRPNFDIYIALPKRINPQTLKQLSAAAEALVQSEQLAKIQAKWPQVASFIN